MVAPENPGLIEQFEEFYRNYYRNEIGELAQKYPNEQKSLYVEYDDLYRFAPDIADDYIARPEQMRQYAEEALRLYDLPVDVNLGHANVRVHKLPERVRLADVRSDHLGHLIEIYGTIRKAETPRSAIQNAAWVCQRCGTMTRVPASGPDPETPHECQGCERSGPFELNSEESEYRDYQRLVIEQRDPENITEGDTESIVAHAHDDLAGTVNPGEHIVATGVLKREGPGEFNDGTLTDKRLELTAVIEGEAYGHLSYSEAEKREIIELSNDPDIFEKFTQSLAPTVVGREDVKLGVLLQLFSGVRKTLPDETIIRGDPHVLLMGDPSTAKSRLLNYASRLAPRSVEVSGESSEVGLTASMARSGGDGNPWEVTGGALVLADEGLIAIDNFDTLRSEAQQSVANVIEEQKVKISKATITDHLRARTAVLAAAQPKYGRFDEYEPIGEQVDLEPGLISQFDLLFMLNDKPDPEVDPEVAEGVLAANYAGEMAATRRNISTSSVSEDELAEATEPITPPIAPELARKYIAYARRNCSPTMTEEAKEHIKDFYVDLRAQGYDDDAPVPVTTRKLEALVRLAEASARIRLSDTIEANDTERITSLVQRSLRDVGIEPETGEFDADIVEAGRSKTQRDRIDTLRDLIMDLSDQHQDGAPIEKVYDRAESMGMTRGKIEHELQKLRRQGEIYEPAEDYLRPT